MDMGPIPGMRRDGVELSFPRKKNINTASTMALGWGKNQPPLLSVKLVVYVVIQQKPRRGLYSGTTVLGEIHQTHQRG